MENNRNIWHIDVGDMSKEQLQTLLEQIKTEIDNRSINEKE